MGMKSKRKGSRGERELSKELARLFGVEVSRGVQYKGTPDSPDILGLPGIHVECKRAEKIRLYEAVDQAVAEAGDNIPIVCHRTSRHPWLATVRLDDLPELAVKLYLTLAEEA